jgi:spermidine/putrescine transport system permease protein
MATEVHEGRVTSRASMHLVGALLGFPGLGWLLAFLVLPVGGLAVLAFARRGAYGSVDWTFSLENLRRIAGWGLFGWSSDHLEILLRSGVFAVVTTIACLALALPMAFWICDRGRTARLALMALVTVPSCINLVVRTYAWMLLLGAQSPPVRLARWIGVLGAEQAMYPGWTAVLLGMVSCMLPFAILPLYASAERLDWSIVEAARDLHAGAWRTFRHGVLPQIVPGLVAAVVLTAIPSLGMFVVSDLLGGSRTMLVGNLVQQQFGSASDWPFGAMAGLVLIAGSLVSLWILLRHAGSSSRDTGKAP